MNNALGARIHAYRQSLNLTQQKFGRKYGRSGPAIFKFEKGYMKPSLELWALFRPTGKELNTLRDTFGVIGEGSAESYREALRLIRAFRRPRRA